MAQSDPATGSFSSTRAMAGPIVTETRSTISVAHFPRIASWALLDASRPICSSPPPATILDSIEKQVLDRLKIPQNLMLLTFSLPQLSRSRMDEIRDMLDRWAEWDILTSIASYHSVVKILFGVLSEVSRRRSGNSHTVAEDILQKMSQDVSVIHEQLIGILRVPESYKSFLVCRGPLAQQLLDLLQDLLDSFPESLARPLLSKALLRLSRASGLHPTCFTLSGLQKVGQQVAAGAFGDIWKGLIRGQSVSVKIMRLFRDVKAALLEFGREALIWRQLSHPNLLPFFGLYYLDSRLCLVSPWMSNGHVLEFLENAPPGTDRLSLILDIAMGLEYLHGKHVVHGDLKGMNILVTPSRRACLADFGLSSIADAMTLRFTHSTSASARGGTARYQAPELISTDNPNHFESDVYAFACVCYEILTGKAPFFEFPRDVTVSIKVLEGLRPSRPETVPYDALWVLLQNCWEEQPVKRPDISQIIQRLVRPPIGAKTRQSATDWDEAFSAKVRRSLQDWPLLPSVSAVERRVFGDDAVEACLECSPRLESVAAPEKEAPQPASTSPRLPPLSPPSVYTSSSRNSLWRSSSIISPTTTTEYDFIPTQHPQARTFSYTRLSVPLACLTAEHDVPISSDGRAPQMVEVFVLAEDLAVHRGAPPLPRLPERQRAPSSSSAGFTSLCESYLSMLAQPVVDVDAAAAPATVRDVLASPAFESLGSDFDADEGPPGLFAADADLDLGLGEYLTSYDADADGATPPEDTPFSDFLPTPPMPNGDAYVGEYGYAGLNLFGGVAPPSAHPRALSPPADGWTAVGFDRDGLAGSIAAGRWRDWKPNPQEVIKRPLEDRVAMGPLNTKRKRLGA